MTVTPRQALAEIERALEQTLPVQQILVGWKDGQPLYRFEPYPGQNIVMGALGAARDALADVVAREKTP